MLHGVDMLHAAEDAVDASEAQEPVDNVKEMSGRWSSRSGHSSSATAGRRHGPHAFSRRDTPRHVHVYKHDRGTSPVSTRNECLLRRIITALGTVLVVRCALLISSKRGYILEFKKPTFILQLHPHAIKLLVFHLRFPKSLRLNHIAVSYFN